jgi:Tfp pilus assembly protein PilF
LENEEAVKLLNVSRLNAAMAYIRTKQYSKAIENTTKVLEKEPNDLKGLYRRGLAYLEIQEFSKAQVHHQYKVGRLRVTPEARSSECWWKARIVATQDFSR